ncbi:MAG TPA: hypothetical protein VJ642_05850 [Chromobacteriaceae bacterium]|nr:hypothetical protein [Chromobacteriaceae bacterium]
MHLSNPALNTPLTEQLATAEAALATYQQHREDWQNKAAMVVKHQQAAEAAESSAKGFKQQARAVLLSMMGKTPPKKMAELRAEERAAYSLAEDFRYLTTELELARDAAEIAMLEAGKAYLDAKNRTTQTLAEGRMQEALEQLGGLLSAMSLRRMVLQQPDQVAMWQAQGFDSAVAVVLAEVRKQLEQRLEQFTLGMSQEPILQALPDDDGLNAASTISPLQLNRRRTELAQRQQEHAA